MANQFKDNFSNASLTIVRNSYGKTTTYKKSTKNPKQGYQAIGSAVGRNPLAIIFPASSGTVTGRVSLRFND